MEREPIWEHEDRNIDWEKDNWDEYDWERLLAQQDRKVDELMRMTKLLRDSGMNPYADAQIMRFDGGRSKCDRNCPECGERYSCSEYQEQLADESREATGQPDPEWIQYCEDMERDIPIQRECSDFAVDVMQWFDRVPRDIWDNEPAMDKLAENCGLPGAKIAGGDGLGYKPYTIGGNIANCKRAANAMAKCVEALGVLMSHPETAERATVLKPVAEKCLAGIWTRIEDLRAQARILWGQE
jgi:hypothetical protein